MGNEVRSALVFLVPAGIGLVLFYLVPALRGLYYSFTSYQGADAAGVGGNGELPTAD